MPKQILSVLLICFLSLSLKAQKDTVFQKTNVDVGKIRLNSQNAYFSSFNLFIGEESQRFRLADVDSLTMNRARYLTLSFTIGDNQFQSIAKRYFKGSYELFATWSDQHGELQLLKKEDTVIIINDQNKSLLFDLKGAAIEASDVKVTSKSLTNMAEKTHALNSQSFVKYRKQKGSGLIKQLHFGLRLTSSSNSWKQNYNDETFSSDFSDFSLDYLARFEGRRFFFEPSLSVINTSHNSDSIFYEDLPKFNLKRETSGFVLSTDLGFYILKNPFFKPFVKAGLSFPLGIKHSYEFGTANNAIDDFALKNEFGGG